MRLNKKQTCVAFFSFKCLLFIAGEPKMILMTMIAPCVLYWKEWREKKGNIDL